MKTRKAEVTTVEVEVETDLPDTVGDLFARIHTYAKAYNIPAVEAVSIVLTVTLSAGEWDKPRAEEFKHHIEGLWLGDVKIEVTMDEFVDDSEGAEGATDGE
jgi:hypothetical protein